MSPTGTVEVSAGDDVSFSCLAEGRPLPFVLIRKQKDQADRECLPLIIFIRIDYKVELKCDKKIAAH